MPKRLLAVPLPHDTATRQSMQWGGHTHCFRVFFQKKGPTRRAFHCTVFGVLYGYGGVLCFKFVLIKIKENYSFFLHQPGFASSLSVTDTTDCHVIHPLATQRHEALLRLFFSTSTCPHDAAFAPSHLLRFLKSLSQYLSYALW